MCKGCNRSLLGWGHVRQRLHPARPGRDCQSPERAPGRSRHRPGRRAPRGLLAGARRRRPGGAARRDARGLPQDADPADRPARALRDHRDAARGQLDQPCAQPAPQGDPDGQGAGRGRARALPLRRRRDPRRRPGGAARPAPLRAAEVLLDLQLPDPDLGRHRRHRLARRRRRDRQPGAAVPLLLRPLRPRDDPGLQGGVVPPAAGLRDPAHAVARHRRAEGDGPGRGGPLVVAEPDDVRARRTMLRPTPPSRWPGGSSGSPTTTCASGSST